jgi:hypothetical protein
MSEYTYEFPDSTAFLYTLRRVLEVKQENHLSELLQGAECSFSSFGQFSRIRWNTYDTTIRFSVLIEKFDLFPDSLKKSLLKYADAIFPSDAGFELTSIEIYPQLSLPPNKDAMFSSSVTNALLSGRYKPVWGEPSIEDKYQCDVFMVMPFRPELNVVYTDVVKPTIEAIGLTINRGDDPFTDKDIMYDVWSMLNACKLVIADCTGRNPNVFYELGVAHTLGKPVIMLTQEIDTLPFDVSGKRAIAYNIAFHQIDTFKSKLEKAVLSILPPKASSDASSDEDEIPF